MTPQEAIEIITNAIQTENMTAEQDKALAIVQKATDKQIPKKVKKVVRTTCNIKTIVDIQKFNFYNPCNKKEVPKYREDKYNDYLCPVCNALTKDGTPEYCWRCGQALDWGG